MIWTAALSRPTFRFACYSPCRFKCSPQMNLHGSYRFCYVVIWVCSDWPSAPSYSPTCLANFERVKACTFQGKMSAQHVMEARGQAAASTSEAIRGLATVHSTHNTVNIPIPQCHSSSRFFLWGLHGSCQRYSARSIAEHLLTIFPVLRHRHGRQVRPRLLLSLLRDS